jgi:hypothetical protein
MIEKHHRCTEHLQVMTYLGAQSANNRLQTVFVWNEDYIVSSDEATNTAVVWDSVTGTTPLCLYLDLFLPLT